MSDRHDPDPGERDELTEQDLAIAALVGRYIERREQGAAPRVHDLLSVAAPSSATPPSTSCAPCSPSTNRP